MSLYYAIGGTAYDRLLLRCDEIFFSYHAQLSIGSNNKLDGWSRNGCWGFSFDGLLMVDADDMLRAIASYCSMEGPYEISGTALCMNELYKGEGVIYMQQGMGKLGRDVWDKDQTKKDTPEHG